MSKVVRFNHPGDGDWVMRRCHGVYNDKIDQVIAVARDGEIAGGIVYNLFLKTAIMMHVAGSDDNWPTRDWLWMIFDFPFNILGVKWCMGLVDSANTRALDVDKRLGFHEIARLPGILEGGNDLIVLGMEKHECVPLNKMTPRYYSRNLVGPERVSVGVAGHG
jgi:hypothetical protein